jgi:nucleoside-diphosphate-sugar epimerase
VKGDITNKSDIEKAFEFSPELCIHAAAQINVQDSIDNPEKNNRINIEGTLNILDEAVKHQTKVCLIGTCMVYDTSGEKPIGENHPINTASPYAESKVRAEEAALEYYKTQNLPVVVLRPFNTYGPFQKTNMEGGVVSIFLNKELDNEVLSIYGDGTQTRDLLYVEDCADFIINGAFSEKAVGEVINAGTGSDISVNDLAKKICKDENRIKHIEHHHPQAEIQKLVCDPSKATNLLGWKPKVSLEEGIEKTKEWIKKE